MTEEEVVKVTKIMLTADGFCSNCNTALIKQLQKAFPEHVGTIDGIYQKVDWYKSQLNEAWSKWINEPWETTNEAPPEPNIWEILCE